MKKVLFIFAVIVLTVGFTSKVQAQVLNQVTESTSASAELVAAGTVTEAAALNFGQFTASAAGTVTVAASAGATAVEGGGVKVIAGGSNPAFYNLTGPLGTQATVGYVAQTILLTGSGTATGDNMSLTLANSTPAVFAGAPSVSSFYVGGVLTIDATQLIGPYLGTFEVRVDF